MYWFNATKSQWCLPIHYENSRFVTKCIYIGRQQTSCVDVGSHLAQNPHGHICRHFTTLITAETILISVKAGAVTSSASIHSEPRFGRAKFISFPLFLTRPRPHNLHLSQFANLHLFHHRNLNFYVLTTLSHDLGMKWTEYDVASAKSSHWPTVKASTGMTLFPSWLNAFYCRQYNTYETTQTTLASSVTHGGTV